MCLTPDRAPQRVKRRSTERSRERATLPVQLLIMAKAPVAGSAKTRLCPPLDPVEAALVARAALVDTLDAAVAAGMERVVLVLEGEPGDWLSHGIDVQPQCAGDLSVRLETAVGEAWSGSCLPVLVIGMDTPQVTAMQLRDAAACLLSTETDAVLGPAADGGFWMIGLRTPVEGVFAGVPMSVPDTGHEQRARLDALGLRTRTLGVLRDVDEYADAVEVARLVPDSHFAQALSTLRPGGWIEERPAGASAVVSEPC